MNFLKISGWLREREALNDPVDAKALACTAHCPGSRGAKLDRCSQRAQVPPNMQRLSNPIQC